MRTSIYIATLALPLLATATYASNSYSANPSGYSFGYSSDEFFSGGSYLGVDTRDVTPDRLGALNLKDEHGVEVTMVDQDAPAGKAGVKEQDVILNVNGTAIESVEQLRRVIREIPAGRMITLGISRNGQPLTLKAQLADRSKEFAYTPKSFKFAMPAVPAVPAIPAMPAMPAMADMDYPVSVVVVHSWMRSGLMVENITPQLGEYFGAKSGQGVLVRSVEKGSRAEKAGFRAGDVIIKANGEAINDAGDFSRALRSRKDNTANITVIRDKKEQTFTLTLPPSRQTGQVLHESLEIPEIDIQTRAALTEVRAEMAKLQPQLQCVTREVQKEMLAVKPELDRVRSETRAQRQEMQRQMREAERELERTFRETRQAAKNEADI